MTTLDLRPLVCLAIIMRIVVTADRVVNNLRVRTKQVDMVSTMI